MIRSGASAMNGSGAVCQTAASLSLPYSVRITPDGKFVYAMSGATS